MKMVKVQIVFGLTLLIVGILFDFLFVQGKVSMALLETNPDCLNSWEKQLYDLTKFYMISLGLVNIALAVLTSCFPEITKLDQSVFYLVVIGSILLILSGIWYANAGPSFEWENRCTVLTIGLAGIILGLVLEICKFLPFRKAS